MSKYEKTSHGSESGTLLLAATWRLLEHSREKIFIKDKDLIYRGASKKFAQMAGWNAGEELIGKTDFEIFQDQALAQHYRYDDLLLISSSQDLLNYVEPITAQDGHARYASTSKFLLRDREGQFAGIVGISRDITNEYYLRRHSNPALQYLFDLPPRAYFAAYLDLDDWRVVNEHHQAVDGISFGVHEQIDVLMARAHERIADRRCPAASFYRDFSRDAILSLFESGRTCLDMEYRRHISHGQLRWVMDEIHILRDNVNGHLCMMLVVWDVHAAKLEEAERIRTAERDELTGVLNRKATMHLIQERLQNAHDGDRHALLMIDANNFKPVNDTYGHQAGDQVLRVLAEEIDGCFRSSDIVGRIGGDEFFVLMTHVTDRSSIEQKVSHLLRKIQGVHYQDVYLSASIGVSVFPEDATTMDALYATADKAMYVAKTTRCNIAFSEDLPTGHKGD